MESKIKMKQTLTVEDHALPALMAKKRMIQMAQQRSNAKNSSMKKLMHV